MSTNGHGTTATNGMTRTQSFTSPLTPIIKEKVGDVATRLSEVGGIIDAINLQSASGAVRSPTMSDLEKDIGLLRKDVQDMKIAQKKEVDNLRKNVENDLKESINKALKSEIEKTIKDSIEAQVKVAVGEWGKSPDTRRFVENLKGMVQGNDVLLREAQIKLDNSRSRHENSTLDEHADFDTELSKIKLPTGDVGEAFPRTIKTLFSYDERKVVQLLNEYGLQELGTHLDNLNRFLTFIGLRFWIPEQSLILLDNPPEYTSNVSLESSMEKLEPERPPPEPAATNDDPLQAQVREKQRDEKRTESEKDDVPQDRGVGQKPAEVDTSAFIRRQPSAAMTHHQVHNPTRTIRTTNLATAAPPPQQQSPASNLPWWKSLTDSF